MEKVVINSSRLTWCINTAQTDIEQLSSKLHIAQATLALALANKGALSVAQLEKVAKHFKRSMLFFLDPRNVQEETLYSPQFRTINNQCPIHSSKLRAFIECVEHQRRVYIDLLDELNEPINTHWLLELKANTQHIQQNSEKVREWLGLCDASDFNVLRGAIEAKGIMVMVSNGYHGKWQIDKKSAVRGFSLCYDVLPVIVVKKQASQGAQAFTLLHELAHLLLHKESAIDHEEDFYRYHGKEKEANELAGNVLVPDAFLPLIDTETLLSLSINEYDAFLKPFKKRWCVSGHVILVRLVSNHQIPQSCYHDYVAFKHEQHKRDEKPSKPPIPRTYRHREPVHVFGKPFVYAVLDALHNKNITLAKASTYLDNIKISDVRQLEQHV